MKAMLRNLKCVTVKVNPMSFQKFGFTDNFRDREAAEEKVFVSKQERDALKKLLLKIKKDQDSDHVKTEINALEAIFKKNGVTSSEGLVKDILDWKEKHH